MCIGGGALEYPEVDGGRPGGWPGAWPDWLILVEACRKNVTGKRLCMLPRMKYFSSALEGVAEVCEVEVGCRRERALQAMVACSPIDREGGMAK